MLDPSPAFAALDRCAWLGQGVLAIADGAGAGGIAVARRHGTTGVPLGAGHTNFGGLMDLVVATGSSQGAPWDLQLVLQR